MSVDAENLSLDPSLPVSLSINHPPLVITAVREILLKDIPGIEDYLPEDVDLNRSINAPLKNKEGEDYSANDDNNYMATCRGFNALFAAVIWGNRDLFELLLRHGANPNSTTTMIETQQNKVIAENVTISMFAISRYASAKIFKALLSWKPDFSLKDSNGNTVIDWAACFEPPVQALDFNKVQRYFTSRLNDKSRIPLLAAIYYNYIINMCHELHISIQPSGEVTTMPLKICEIINEYQIELGEISRFLAPMPRPVHVQFYKMLKQAHDKYQRDKMLEKFTSLSCEKLDKLLILAETEQLDIVEKPSNITPQPLLFSKKRQAPRVVVQTPVVVDEITDESQLSPRSAAAAVNFGS